MNWIALLAALSGAIAVAADRARHGEDRAAGQAFDQRVA